MSSHSKLKYKISAGLTTLSEMLSPDVVPAVTPPAPSEPLIDFLTPPIEDTIQFNVCEYTVPGAPRAKSHAHAVLPTEHRPKPITSVSSTNEALQHMQKQNPELLGFLSTIVSKVNELKDSISHQRRDDVSVLSEDSLSTEGSRKSRRTYHRNHLKPKGKASTRKRPKTPSRDSPLEPTRILQHSETQPPLQAITPLQRPRHDSNTNHMNAAKLRLFTLGRSFQEELNKHFPPHVHQAILEMGVSTIEDTYFIVMEDLIKSPTISCLQARKVHSLLQHHQVHHSYPDKIQPQIPFGPNYSQVPLKYSRAT